MTREPHSLDPLLDLLGRRFNSWEWQDEMDNLAGIVQLAAQHPNVPARHNDDERYRVGVRRLVNNLGEDHWGIVNGSAEALGAIGSPQAVQPLLLLLKRRGPPGGTVKEAKTLRIVANAVATILDQSIGAVPTEELQILAELPDMTELIPLKWEDMRGESHPAAYQTNIIDCSVIRRRATEEIRAR